MKRLTAFFVLFLTALCFALTASAAGDAIRSVTIDGNAVKVSLTAQSDCALWGAVYGESGKMTAARSENVRGAADPQTFTLSFDNIPANAYAKAFLLNAETFAPLCACGDTRNPSDEPYTSDVYAILYDDGALVFQRGDTPQAGREVKNAYAVDMAGSYDWDNLAPWHDVADSIERVEFADKIQPECTAFWFYECANIKEISNLNKLDTANVKDMRCMFRGCEALAALDLSAFNTANVTNMKFMFEDCKALAVLDLSAFNTANVTDMAFMFADCRSLTALDLSGFNTTRVTAMDDMFLACRNLTELNISGFNTANVTSMNEMFNACSELTSLDLSGFDTSKVKAMGGMFIECCKLETLDLSAFNTANVTKMYSMFSYCWGLKTLDLSGFNTANVTNMSKMFAECLALTTLDISGFNTANVVNMLDMFSWCDNIVTIHASEQFMTGQVTESDNMFYHCSSLVGGAGTRYDATRTDSSYARIDDGPDNPGYFTAK